MIEYIIKKIFYGFLVLWGVISLVFFLFNILPGDPAQMMMSHREDSSQLEVMKKKYAFDKPLFQQYILYLNDLSIISLHENKDVEDHTYLDQHKYSFISLFSIRNTTVVLKSPYFRESFVRNGKNVSDIIYETLPATIVLAISSIVIAVLFGILFGALGAINSGSFFDKFILYFSSLGMSVPSFFSAVIIGWIFAYLLSDYTGLLMTGSLYSVDDYGRGEYLSLKNLILPSITLGIRPLAVITQITRSSLLDVLSADYIRTAHAKGLERITVIWKHAFRNALNPVVTIVSGWFASLLAGAVFVEYIFGWNGLGKEIVNSLNTLDLPVLMGSVLIIAIIFVCINIMVDVLYAIIDPRVQLK